MCVAASVSVLVCFLVFLDAQLTHGQAPSSVHFSSVLFRHGDRSPMQSFPGDLYNESAWPQGFGQLSQTGMKQEYALGSYIRQRYSGFLSATYQRAEVYIQSSAIDRTLMSAQCVLAAVFPPNGRQMWKPDLSWQPVPVHSIDISNDKILHYDFDVCPTMAKHAAEFENNQIMKDLKVKHRVLIEKVYNSTNGSISTIHGLGQMYDTLLCEKIHGLRWPKWVSFDNYREIRQIKIVAKYQKLCGSVKVVRLTGGMLLDKMLSDMRLIARNMLETGDLKAILYSAHDTTVLALMCALNVYNHRLVPYSTSMYLELHHDTTPVSYSPALTGWFVQVWLRNETQREPFLLTVPGCTGNCSLSKLISLTKGNIATDWIRECGYLTFPYFTQLWQIVLITVAAGIGLVFLILIVMSCCNGSCARRRLRPRPSNYGKLRASEVMAHPEEMPMMSSAGGDSDIEG